MFSWLFQPCLAALFFNHIGIGYGSEVLSTNVSIGWMIRVFTCGPFYMGVNAHHPTRLFAVPALMDLKTAWNLNNELISWDPNSLCSTWRGLTCNGSNFVTRMWAVLKGYNHIFLHFFILQYIHSPWYREVPLCHLIVEIQTINRWML